MLLRISYGILAICALVAMIAADAIVARDVAPIAAKSSYVPHFVSEMLFRGSLIPIACALAGALACSELSSLLNRTGVRPATGWAMGSCLVLVLAPWLSAAGLLGGGPLGREAVDLQLALVAFAFIGAGIAQMARRDMSRGLADLAGTWLLIVYAGLLPSFLTLLRCDIDLGAASGAWIVLTFLAICKGSDIGAYFVGTRFGRHKLIPHVSPNKSVEGAIAGVVASCLLAVLFLAVRQATVGNEGVHGGAGQRIAVLLHDATVMFHPLSYAQAIVLGALVSIAGQIGDLVESVFKRSAGAKDSANLLPGFGGVLDIVDSPFAAAPMVWFLLARVWYVV